jgi:endonuclease III
MASASLPASVPELQRAGQLLRRHGQTICRRKNPAGGNCPVWVQCPSSGNAVPLY